MTWLYLPPEAIAHALNVTGKEETCSDYPYALVQEDLTLASTSPPPDIELWVTSSGTPTLRPRSWRGWQTRPWIARLSGTMLPILTASHGAAWWISSMAAIRANPSALLEKSWATKTQDICGRTSPASCVKSNRPSVSSKMSPDIYDWALNKSMMTFDQWVTALRQGCLQRKKSVRRTSGKDCLFWPTATAMDAKVKFARSPDKMIRKDRRNVLRTPGLAETVLQPEAYPYSKKDLELAKQGKPYRTTRVQWPTPRAQEPGSTSSDHGLSLNEVSKMWSTPVARDWKEGFLINNKTATRSNLSRQAPRMQLGGKSCSNMPRTLNPLFVEALMGWPQGWTIAWTDCGSAVTGLSRWWQLMHSVLSALPQESALRSMEPETNKKQTNKKDETQLCLI